MYLETKQEGKKLLWLEILLNCILSHYKHITNVSPQGIIILIILIVLITYFTGLKMTFFVVDIRMI
jgi:hypothetical protein